MPFVPHSPTYASMPARTARLSPDEFDRTQAALAATTALAEAASPQSAQDSQVIDASRAIHGVVGSGDRTAALQAFLDARSVGDELLLPAGTLRVDGTVTLSVNNVVVNLRRTTVWDRSAATATTDGIRVTGTGVTIRGGSLLNPAEWYDGNVTPAYGAIHVTGADCTIDGLKMTNVPKIGIWSKDVDGLLVKNCRIVGNYVGPQRGTGHYAMLYDPPPSGTAARIHGNTFSSCVQGVMIGNWGAASNSSASADIVGNIFESCWNHGVYNAGTSDGVNVTGNKFHHCQTPVALTGKYHTVTGNVMTTTSTGSADRADETGISMREAFGCVVTGNTIQGDGGGDVVIDFANYVANQSSIGGNVCSNNTIDITSGTVAVGIHFGNGNTLTCFDNVVSNNTIKCAGKAGSGLISFGGAAELVAWGNKIEGNTVIVQGESHGMFIMNQSHMTIQNNSVRLEWDAPSAKVAGAIYLLGSTYCKVSGNDFYVPATFGTNMNWRGIYEVNTCLNNRYEGNSWHADMTKLSVASQLSIQPGTNAYLDARGPGVPTAYVAVGSKWSRDDGAGGTGLYVKETDSTSLVWRNLGDPRRKMQTLSSNGVVTIDASQGDAFITLAANATSSTITNPSDDQILRITWLQDNTGGRTYVWPTNTRFAGGAGSAPNTTTVSTQTTVTFRYDINHTIWHELSRAVAVV